MEIIVNTADFFPYAWIIHLIRAIITFDVIHILLKPKINLFKTFVWIVIPSMVFSYISLQIATRKTEVLCVCLYYFMQFIICFFITEAKVFAKILTVLLSVSTYMCSCIIYPVIKGLILDSDIFYIMFDTNITLMDFLCSALTTFSFHFIILAIIKLVKNKTQKSFSYRAILSFFFLYPITQLIMVYQVFSVFAIHDSEWLNTYYNYFPMMSLSFSFVVLLCIVADFCIIFIVDYIEKINERTVNREKELLKNKMDYQQMLILKEEKQEFRKIKHDYLNLLTTAQGFIEMGKPEKALEIIKGTQNDILEIAGVAICSNEIINTIFHIKQQQAKNSNIGLAVNITEGYTVLPDDYDFCRLLNNIIDNSLNAASMLENKRECKIDIIIDEQTIIIRSENGFVHNKSKKKSGDHGNGISIIKEIASKYGGKYAARQDNGIWYTETFLENKKSANSTPPRNLA